ncbi:MAG: hypothetical protein FJ398_25780, partial [Verrucomicrobia bacterium]|nr:hypothetical protein [Verrucomicrobiota bacterium]
MAFRPLQRQTPKRGRKQSEDCGPEGLWFMGHVHGSETKGASREPSLRTVAFRPLQRQTPKRGRKQSEDCGPHGLRACPKIPRGPVFAPKAGWRGATKENILPGSSTEEQRS